jgi:hypothetical protein
MDSYRLVLNQVHEEINLKGKRKRYGSPAPNSGYLQDEPFRAVKNVSLIDS